MAGTTESSRESPTPLGSDASQSDQQARGTTRSAGAVFVLVEVLALPLLMYWGRARWFVVDDWDFLATRHVGNLGDLFRPHMEHWTTLPVLAYRGLFQLVGIRVYWPYQLLVVVLHLCVALALWVVMRRAGVRPWMATAVGTVFVFFGAGRENVLVAFQITFVGALLFGLLQLVLASHEGSVNRRDTLGLIAGLAALMCSGVGVTMVAVVGVAMLLLRGWKVAALHTVPLAAIYLIWMELAPKPDHRVHSTFSVTSALDFVWRGIRSTFGSLGPFPGSGVLLALVLILGVVSLFRRHPMQVCTDAVAFPVSLLAGAIGFLVLTALARSGHVTVAASDLPQVLSDSARRTVLGAFGPKHAQQSRYVYVVAAFMLPVVAIAAEELICRWRVLRVVVLALLLAALPINVDRFIHNRDETAAARQVRRVLSAAPGLPIANRLPRSLMPEPLFAGDATMGWLRDNLAAGRAPAPPHLTAVEAASLTLSLALRDGDVPAGATCHDVSARSTQLLASGAALTVKTGVVVVRYVPASGVASVPRSLRPSTVVALAGPLRLLLSPAGGTRPVTMVCE